MARTKNQPGKCARAVNWLKGILKAVRELLHRIFIRPRKKCKNGKKSQGSQGQKSSRRGQKGKKCQDGQSGECECGGGEECDCDGGSSGGSSEGDGESNSSNAGENEGSDQHNSDSKRTIESFINRVRDAEANGDFDEPVDAGLSDEISEQLQQAREEAKREAYLQSLVDAAENEGKQQDTSENNGNPSNDKPNNESEIDGEIEAGLSDERNEKGSGYEYKEGHSAGSKNEPIEGAPGDEAYVDPVELALREAFGDPGDTADKENKVAVIGTSKGGSETYEFSDDGTGRRVTIYPNQRREKRAVYDD